VGQQRAAETPLFTPTYAAGELLEYVTGELNVREVECCSDPLKYTTLRAEPDLQVRAACMHMGFSF
jgi:hypothetical protein